MSMHSYIDVKKLYDFSKPKTIKSIYKDLEKKYKITNVAEYDDEDALQVLCEALYDDYINEMANYESYVEVGMNARIMMELRKSAVFPVGEKYFNFFIAHNSCETVDDIKGMRIDFMKNICEGYMDLNYQYYMIIKYMQGDAAKNFGFDFETCFGDRDDSKQSMIENYRWDFVNDCMQYYRDRNGIVNLF